MWQRNTGRGSKETPAERKGRDECGKFDVKKEEPEFLGAAVVAPPFCSFCDWRMDYGC